MSEAEIITLDSDDDDEPSGASPSMGGTTVHHRPILPKPPAMGMHIRPPMRGRPPGMRPAGMVQQQHRGVSPGGGGMNYNAANYADLFPAPPALQRAPGAPGRVGRPPAPQPGVLGQPGMSPQQEAALINFAKKFPKRPGVFPPFALFTQEQREKMLAENGELSFGDSGRMMGELWHKLSDDQKEDYRKRAKDVTDQKLKDWQARLEKLTPQQRRAVQRVQGGGGASPMGQRGGGQDAAAVAASVGPVPQRKRRAHAYAVFSSEMRRSLGIMGGQSDVPINEVTRIVAEKWRDLDATSRRKYEDRANMINAQEDRRFAQAQAQHQRQLNLAQQRQQQINQQRMMQHQQRQQQGGGPGLRIASVSSLQKPQKQSPVSLPSSISISRVQNEQQAPQVRQVQQRLPPGTMISGQRPGPRGAGPGMGAGPRGGMRPGMGMMGRGMAPGGQRMPYMNGGGGVKRPGGAVNPGGMHPAAMMGKRPRLMGPGAGGVGGVPGAGTVPPRMCRLCGTNTTAYQKLSTRPDVLEVLEPVLGFTIVPETDRREGYPINVCRKCTALALTCHKFKKTVEEGQARLAGVIKQRREAKERMERMEQERRQQQAQAQAPMSILPDIEMDMDIDDGGPAPTPTRLLPLPASLREQNSTNSTKEPPASGGESESSSSHFVESEESPFKISNVTGDTEKSSEKAEDGHEKSNGQSEAPENESKDEGEENPASASSNKDGEESQNAPSEPHHATTADEDDGVPDFEGEVEEDPFMSLEDEGEEVEGDFAPGDANGENSGDPFTPSATEEENSEMDGGDASNGLNGDHEVDDEATKETENAENDEVSQQEPLAGDEASKTLSEEDNTQTDENAGNEDETTQDSALEEASHDDQAEVKNEAQDMEEMEGDGEVEDGENFDLEEVPSAAEPDNEADGDEIEKNQENPEDFAETSQPAQVEENVEDQAPQQGEEEDQTNSLETEEVDGEKVAEETEEADVAEEVDENQGVSPPHGEDEGRFDVSSQPDDDDDEDEGVSPPHGGGDIVFNLNQELENPATDGDPNQEEDA